jgi:hypothetical protein
MHPLASVWPGSVPRGRRHTHAAPPGNSLSAHRGCRGRECAYTPTHTVVQIRWLLSIFPNFPRANYVRLARFDICGTGQGRDQRRTLFPLRICMHIHMMRFCRCESGFYHRRIAQTRSDQIWARRKPINGPESCVPSARTAKII